MTEALFQDMADEFQTLNSMTDSELTLMLTNAGRPRPANRIDGVMDNMRRIYGGETVSRWLQRCEELGTLMSHTRCNFCTLKDFRRQAKQANRIVTLVPRPLAEGVEFGMLGQDVYIHPADEPIDDWWAAWLAEIPGKCVC